MVDFTAGIAETAQRAFEQRKARDGLFDLLSSVLGRRNARDATAIVANATQALNDRKETEEPSDQSAGAGVPGVALRRRLNGQQGADDADTGAERHVNAVALRRPRRRGRGRSSDGLLGGGSLLADASTEPGTLLG